MNGNLKGFFKKIYAKRLLSIMGIVKRALLLKQIIKDVYLTRSSASMCCDTNFVINGRF